MDYESLLPSGNALQKYRRYIQVEIEAARRWKSLQWFADSCLNGTLPFAESPETWKIEVPGKAMLWTGGPGEFLFPDRTWTPFGSGGPGVIGSLWPEDEFGLSCSHIEAYGDADGDGTIDTPVAVEVRNTCYEDSTEVHYLYKHCNYKGETLRASYTRKSGYHLVLGHNTHEAGVPLGIYKSEIACRDPHLECLLVVSKSVNFGLPTYADVLRSVQG